MGDQPRLFPWPLQQGIGPTLDRSAIITEVQSGLRNERSRLADAQENASFADLQGRYYLERREAETEFDYAGRIKKTSGFVHQCLNRLTQHTYNPGPMRTVADGGAAGQLLGRVYDANHIDAVMNEAERLSTINDVAAIQVSVPADEAKRRRKPVDLQVWGSEEFAVFLDPNDQRQPCAVVTIDDFDNQARYRLWFDDVVHTFQTRKAGGGSGKETDAAVYAYELEGSPEKNEYGVLPFAFVHYRAPVRQFWTHAPGTFLRECEKALNAEVSDLAEAIQKYSFPIGWFTNVGPEFNPEIGRGRFIRLVRGGAQYGGDGYVEGGDPAAGYLQAQLAIEAIWEDIRNTLSQAAEAVDLPASALRLDYNDAPSGTSLIVHAFPLLARARQRRPIYQWAECDLARVICAVYGGYHGRPELVAAGQDLQVVLSWPEPRIPIPGPERDQSDQWELQAGVKSRLMVVQERYGLTREQACDHLRQVAADEAEATAILPRPEPEPEPDAEPAGDGEEQADEG